MQAACRDGDVVDAELAGDLLLHQWSETRVSDFGVDLGLDIAYFLTGLLDLVHPFVEAIERDTGLAGCGAQGEEAMQFEADFFDREVLLALLPNIGEVIGEQAQRGRGAFVIASH
jgi:hypothetical protein